MLYAFDSYDGPVNLNAVHTQPKNIAHAQQSLMSVLADKPPPAS